MKNLGGKEKETERQKERGKERRKQNKEDRGKRRKTEVKGLCTALLCKVSVYIQSV